MIVFAHLLNDRSGSPQVLCRSISALASTGDKSCLFIGSDGSGCLDEAIIETTRYWYKRTPYRLLTFVTYLVSQVSLLFHLLHSRNIDRDALVFVNTLLPFGAAIYGRVTGRQVVYHVHEASISPTPLRWLLVGVARMTSSLNIYVSDAHARALRIKGVRSARLYNALNDQFAAKAYATAYKHRHGGVFRVLMVASLRDYKGVPEFIKLAVDFFEVEDIHFDLLVNDEQTDISRYFRKKSKPINLSVHPRVVDTTPFYANASLVLNLSRVNECIETFGLTILEAMAFGIPVIAPPIGGPAELVTHDVHGLLIDSKLSKKLFDGVNFLRTDEVSCNRFSAACRLRASEFSQSVFSVEIVRLIKGLNIYADF